MPLSAALNDPKIALNGTPVHNNKLNTPANVKAFINSVLCVFFFLRKVSISFSDVVSSV